MSAIPVSQSRVEMAQIMEPNDANFLGKVFGGRILEMIDLCAYAASSKYAGRICVTASFDRVDFHEPINVGELVTMVGSVSFVGRTSLEITIEIYAQNLLTRDQRHTNTARVTMVAIDQNGKPAPVPPLLAETRDEKLRFLEGRLRRELRAQQRADLEAKVKQFSESSDEEIERLLSAERLT